VNTNELLLYRQNLTPSRLVLTYLIFNTAQTIFTLNGITVAAEGLRVAEIILLNIILSFVVFVTASEVKRYSRPWSLAGIVVAIFQVLRVFLIPGTVGGLSRALVTGCLLISAFTLFAASLWSLGLSGKYAIALADFENDNGGKNAVSNA